jgi:phosphate starvation-inducible PhoH-like protein
VLKNVEDIGVCNMTSADVVRHPLIQKIVEAYDRYEDNNVRHNNKRSTKKTGK